MHGLAGGTSNETGLTTRAKLPSASSLLILAELEGRNPHLTAFRRFAEGTGIVGSMETNAHPGLASLLEEEIWPAAGRRTLAGAVPEKFVGEQAVGLRIHPCSSHGRNRVWISISLLFLCMIWQAGAGHSME